MESPQYPLYYQNNFGDSLLHYAVKGESMEMIQYLLLKGLHPHQPNKLLATPLYYAIENGNEKIFAILANDKRQNFDWLDKFGETVIHVAAREG